VKDLAGGHGPKKVENHWVRELSRNGIEPGSVDVRLGAFAVCLL